MDKMKDNMMINLDRIDLIKGEIMVGMFNY